jgi:hypothetical protein
MVKHPAFQFEDALYFLAGFSGEVQPLFEFCSYDGLMEKRLAQRRRVLKAGMIVSRAAPSTAWSVRARGGIVSAELDRYSS